MPSSVPIFNASYLASNDPNHWRWRAETARVIAETFIDAQARGYMLIAARAYDRIAHVAETRPIHSAVTATTSTYPVSASRPS